MNMGLELSLSEELAVTHVRKGGGCVVIST